MRLIFAAVCLSLASSALAQDDLTSSRNAIPEGATSVFDQTTPRETGQTGTGDYAGPKTDGESQALKGAVQLGSESKAGRGTAGDDYRASKRATDPNTGEVVTIDPHIPTVFEKDGNGQVTGLLHKGAGAVVGAAKMPDPNTADLIHPEALPNTGLGTVGALPYLSPKELQDLGEPPPPLPTPEHPVTAEMTRAYNEGVQSRFSQRAEEAERSGDAATAALLSAYASKPNEALRQAAQALAARPDDKKALTAMMLAQEQQGRHEEAREMARRALAADPQNQIARLMVGAEGSLDKGAALQKKFGKVDLGKTAETDGVADKLLGLFGAARGGAGGGALGQTAGAGTANALPQAAGGGIVHPAAPVYDVAQPLTPAQQLVLRAVHKHEIGDEQGAMLALTEAIDRDPRDAGAFVVRAEVDNTLTKYAAAVLDATKAFDLAPAKPTLSARALRARAYANLELKQWVQALADASHSVDQDPQNGLGYLYRAMAEDKLGRGNAAAADLTQAVKIDPALTPLAKPLMIKYGLQQAPSQSGRRSWPVLFVFVGGASLLLAYGMRKLVAGPRLTTTGAQRLRESTPVP